MDFNIFVNNNGIIKINNVHIDTTNFKKIQSDIDTWNGKGDILTATTSMFELFEKYDPDTKIDIISSQVIGKKTIFFDNFFDMENVDICKLEYYAYKQCELSILCEEILDANKTIIKRSSNLNKLLNWSPNNSEELLFVKLLLKYITIEPLNTNNLSNNKLIDLLKSFANILDNYKLYSSELNKQITATGEIQSKARVKKLIFTSIPNSNNIRKICQ